MKFPTKLFILTLCYQLCDQQQRGAEHHSSYRVTHHMGKMKIKANPEGADFDFSGGDLHVDLHPAHSDVVPIYNYFHSDYHDYHVQPIEHHYSEIHHHSGEMMDHHHQMEHGHHGEDDDGYDHQHLHNHENHHDNYHDYDERHHSGDHHMMHDHDEEMEVDHEHHDMPHVFPIGMWHPGEGGGNDHYGGDEHRNEGNELVGNHEEFEGLHGEVHPENIHHNREESWGDNMGHHGGGDYGGHSRENIPEELDVTENGRKRGSLMEPMHMENNTFVGHHDEDGDKYDHQDDNDNHHLRIQHLDRHMLHHPEEEDMDKDHEDHHMPHVFPIGLWHSGKGGADHEGDEHHGGGQEFVDNHKEFEGLLGEVHPSTVHHNREESWGDDTVRHDGDNHSDHIKENIPQGYVKKTNASENGMRRGFLMKPIHMKGSIIGEFRKHWREEEKNGDKESDRSNSDDYDKTSRKEHEFRSRNEEHETKGDDHYKEDHPPLYHLAKHHNEEPSKPDLDSKLPAEEFIRNFNFPKKIYPSDDAVSSGSEPGPPIKLNHHEQVESTYKEQDVEAKMFREREKQREHENEIGKDGDEKKDRKRKSHEEDNDKEDEEDTYRHHKNKIKNYNREETNKNRIKDNDDESKERDEKDEIEEDIAAKEKDIQRNAEKAYKSIKEIKDDEENDDDEPIKNKEKSRDHKEGELLWNEDMKESLLSADTKKLHHRESSEENLEGHSKVNLHDETRHSTGKDEDETTHSREKDDDDYDEKPKKDGDDEEENYHDDEHNDDSDEMDAEDRRQYKFHQHLTNMREKSFRSLEKPHDGVERFAKDDQEIDINDQTHEGDVDQMEALRKLEEHKNSLPIQDPSEDERLSMLEKDYSENHPKNEKEDTDRELGKIYEQNHDPKLEGSNHDFYHDPQKEEESQQDSQDDEDDDDEGSKRHHLHLREPFVTEKSKDDVTEGPLNQKELDNKLLNDFHTRFNEETSFQSTEQAEEMLSQMQDVATSNQQKLDSQQDRDSVRDDGLVNSKRQTVMDVKKIESNGKRQKIMGVKSIESNIASTANKSVDNSKKIEFSLLSDKKTIARSNIENTKKIKELLIKHFFVNTMQPRDQTQPRDQKFIKKNKFCNHRTSCRHKGNVRFGKNLRQIKSFINLLTNSRKEK